MKTYKVIVSYIIPFEQVVEYLITTDDEENLHDINFLEENCETFEVLRMEQFWEPQNPEILEIEEILEN